MLAPNFRVIVVDIEASHLKADFGLMLMAGVMTLHPEWKDGKEAVIKKWLKTMEALLRKEPVQLPDEKLLAKWGITLYRIDDSKHFAHDNTNDKEVVQRLLFDIQNAHIVLGYNTERFDIKFLRSRAAYWGLPFPTGFWHGDIYLAARKVFTLHSRSLDSVAAHLGLSLKTPIRPQIWLDALNVGPRGKEARDYIAAHLIFDLLTTAFVFQKIAPYILPTLRKVTQ
jgi:DNA polymerase III epsilon subunit-like protein